MKVCAKLLAVLLSGSSALAQASGMDAGVSVEALLSREPAYQQNWLKLTAQETDLPQWVITLTGVATPLESLKAGPQQYQLGMLCKQHDCFNNRLYLAFNSELKQIDALYVVVPATLADDEAPSAHARLRWLGGPGFELRKLLEGQLLDDPNWH